MLKRETAYARFSQQGTSRGTSPSGNKIIERFLRSSRDGRTNNPALLASPPAGHLIVVLCHAGTFSARLWPAIPRRAERLFCSFQTRNLTVLRSIAPLPLVEFETPEPRSFARRCSCSLPTPNGRLVQSTSAIVSKYSGELDICAFKWRGPDKATPSPVSVPCLEVRDRPLVPALAVSLFYDPRRILNVTLSRRLHGPPLRSRTHEKQFVARPVLVLSSARAIYNERYITSDVLQRSGALASYPTNWKGLLGKLQRPF